MAPDEGLWREEVCAMADGDKRPVCAVVGVGPGNGEALARRFAADGYAVAPMARRTELTARVAAELPRAKAYACDVAEAASVEAAFPAMRVDLGDVDALVYNAGSGVWGNVEEVKAEDLERSWRVNTLGLFLASRQAIPAMRRKGQGAIIVVGATASRRGAAGAAAFAQSKMAQRALAESMARPSLAGGNSRGADRRRRRGRRPGDALAGGRSPGRFLHRSGRRRGDRRRLGQTRSFSLELRSRSPPVQGEVVSA
jgi:NADP-dependent 3-hydroxy acid dehydrogenase YdfG